jgi:hypothetical protein
VPPLPKATVPVKVEARMLLLKVVMLAVFDATLVFNKLIEDVLEVMLEALEIIFEVLAVILAVLDATLVFNKLIEDVLEVMLFVADVILVS